MTLKPNLNLLVAIATGSMLFAAPQSLEFHRGLANDAADSAASKAKAQENVVTVLYYGPLVHDQNWTIKHDRVGPDNQKLFAIGGTCSMIPSDVHSDIGSGFERVTFESQPQGLGIWKMAWVDNISGTTTDGNNFHEFMRFEFTAPTNDGKAPKPNRATPSPGNNGFLEIVPGNVNADALNLDDGFIIQAPRGGVIATSHVHWIFRLQIPPFAVDPLPDFFPFLFQAKYVLVVHEQLAGQLGCDPL